MAHYSMILEQNLKFYNDIKPKNPDGTFTVLATLNDFNTGRLLALATGTQANIKKYQDDIEDCHAESLMKRAFKRHLIELIDSVLKSKCNGRGKFDANLIPRDLIMFISQFPCGFIYKYGGQEPVDESTGQMIDRKPGRGTLVGSKTIYVRKQSCTKKLVRWMSDGLQGKTLARMLGLKCRPRLLLIGNCEPNERYDYQAGIERLSELVSSYYKGSNIDPNKTKDYPSVQDLETREAAVQVIECKGVRRTEFTFSAQKKAQSTSIVWWAEPLEGPGVIRSPAEEAGTPTKRLRATSEEACKSSGNCELLVLGRKKGLTRKQLQRDLEQGNRDSDQKFKLKVGDSMLRKDLQKIEKILADERDQSI